jgi:hypothetical protein
VFDASGRLPVHVALQCATNVRVAPDEIDMGSLLLQQSGEYRGPVWCWHTDERIWQVADLSGKTVREYALESEHIQAGEVAREPQVQEELVKWQHMLAAKASLEELKESSKNSDELKLLRVRCQELPPKVNSCRLLYSIILFGRLDVLEWLLQYDEKLPRIFTCKFEGQKFPNVRLTGSAGKKPKKNPDIFNSYLIFVFGGS